MQMMEGGYVALHRSILNWDWYTDRNTKCLFLHLILTANYAPGSWKGREIKVGQRVTSLSKLADELGMSVKEIRTSLAHLKRTGEVASESTPQYTVITVKNYERFQKWAHAPASQRASYRANEGHAKGKRGANEGQQRNNNNKNNKAINKKIGGSADSPDGGGRRPAIGEGECEMELDGILHRFPSAWYGFAEQRGESIEDYVRRRHM